MPARPGYVNRRAGPVDLRACLRQGRARGIERLPSRDCILPPGAIVFAECPERRPRGRSGRAGYQEPRPGKLSTEEREAIRVAVARGRSLREVAAEFGVSHETVRAALLRVERVC